METPYEGLKFGRVEERAERVLIVATGPSVAEVSFDAFRQASASGVYILAVNRAIEWLPVAHGWFTVDPSRRNRPLMRQRKEGTTYYAAVPDDYGTPGARISHHRGREEPGVIFLRRTIGVGRWKQCNRLSEEPDRIHTGNSAWGALGLAYLMGAKRIGLLGVDGTQERYAYARERPDFPFDHLPRLFLSAVPQLQARGVQVRNGSPISTIRCFDRENPGSIIRWISEREGALGC